MTIYFYLETALNYLIGDEWPSFRTLINKWSLRCGTAGSYWNDCNEDNNNWLTRLRLTMFVVDDYARRTFSIMLINRNIIRRINRRDVVSQDHESREQRTTHASSHLKVQRPDDHRCFPLWKSCKVLLEVFFYES